MGLGGFAVAIVAVIIAVRAQKTADAAVSEERGRIFELEILRELLKDLDESGLPQLVLVRPKTLKNYRLRLKLLSTKLQFWEQVMELDSMSAILELIGLSYEYSTILEKGRAQDREVAWLSNETARLSEQKIFLTPDSHEIDESISKRLLELQAKHDRSLESRDAAQQERMQITSKAEEELRDRLATDVEQAILARILARTQPKPTWWNRYRFR